MENWVIYAITAGVVAFIVVLLTMYVKAPPSVAFILSGFRSTPRVLIGTGGFKVPIIERLDKVFLGQVTVDIKTSKAVPTNDFINVDVDAVCKVRVINTNEGIRLAAKNFLNMTPSSMAQQIQDSLEGNMREVVGSMSLQDINTNRDAFSDEIQKKAATDMEKLGLEIISCNIQNVSDENNLIKDLGADNTFAIKKNAAITKAKAERDIEIAQSEAAKEANDVRVKAQTEIAERNNELAIKQADLKILADTKQADADAAYEIQKQEQQKTINTKTVDAQIEQTKREQVLSQERIKITENVLQAEINAKADADKYQTRINAEALLEQQKRDAEAKAYLAKQEAEAQKARAEALKYSMEQEAEGIKAKAAAEANATKIKGIAEAEAIKAKLEAEARGIEAKGVAEAEAMQKKADAYAKYGDVAKLDIITKMAENVLPQMAENIARPMGNIKDITIYGTTGNEASGMSANVPTVLKQTMDIVKSATGVDISQIAQNATVTNDSKNINLDANGIVK